jgi:phosphopantothenoylcysteine decarboxylase
MDSEMNNSDKKNLLIGCTGSVATIRIDQIIKAFREKFNIKIILTKSAKIFADGIIRDYQKYEEDHGVKFYFDEDEYVEYKEKDTVLHIDVKSKLIFAKLRKWADIVLISPLSANTMAKITNGICDNLLVKLIPLSHADVIILDLCNKSVGFL